MQTTDSDGENDEQSAQQGAYEWWWDERLSTFLDNADAVVEKCLEHVFDGDNSALSQGVYEDVLADIDDIDAYRETLSPQRFIVDENGTYDLDWEIETTAGVVSDVILTCHAEYRDDGREVMTEVNVSIVATPDADGTETVTQPHVVHRSLGS